MNFRNWREMKSSLRGEKTYALKFYCHGNKNLLVGIIGRGFYIFSSSYNSTSNLKFDIIQNLFYIDFSNIRFLTTPFETAQ